MKKFSGIVTALITPFKNRSLDLSSFERLVNHQLENGADGFVINGTTGESPNLEWDEVVQLYSLARKIAGDSFSIILGTGTNSTKNTIETTKKAKDLGADAALVVVPYYNKPTQLGMTAHFTAVADATDIPIILYNVPGRTIVDMSVETVQRLSEHKNIIGIKEASGDVQKGKDIKNFCGKNFLVSSGDDSSCISLMLNGGDGVVSVISHIIPKELKKIGLVAREGQSDAIEQYGKYDELNRLLGVEPNPVPVKMALYLMGVIESPELRLPLVILGDGNKDKLHGELTKLGVTHG